MLRYYRTIWFDLDGVLADFVNGALKKYPDPPLAYADVRWSIESQLGVAPAVFWPSLDYAFWRGLEPLPDGFALYSAVVSRFGEDRVGFLSSPSDQPGCLDAKRDWVREYLGKSAARRLFLGSAKDLIPVGDSRTLLIDDHEVNADNWRKAGGSSVLVPRPWNRRREEEPWPVEKLVAEVFP